MHSFGLIRKISITLQLISSGMADTAFVIASLRALRFWGRNLNTLDLRYPHGKKSQGLKSGEREVTSQENKMPRKHVFDDFKGTT